MAKHKTQKAKEGAVVGNNPQVPGVQSQVKKVVYITLAVVAVIIAIILIFVAIHKNKPKSTAMSYKMVSSQVILYNNSGKYGQARDLLQQFINQKPAPTAADKSSAESVLATTYANLKDQKSSLEWRQKALDSAPSPEFGTYVSLAQAYAANNQKAKAIDVYNKAAALNKKTPSPGQSQQEIYIQNQIDALKGAQ